MALLHKACKLLIMSVPAPSPRGLGLNLRNALVEIVVTAPRVPNLGQFSNDLTCLSPPQTGQDECLRSCLYMYLGDPNTFIERPLRNVARPMDLMPICTWAGMRVLKESVNVVNDNQAYPDCLCNTVLSI